MKRAQQRKPRRWHSALAYDCVVAEARAMAMFHQEKHFPSLAPCLNPLPPPPTHGHACAFADTPVKPRMREPQTYGREHANMQTRVFFGCVASRLLACRILGKFLKALELFSNLAFVPAEQYRLQTPLASHNLLHISLVSQAYFDEPSYNLISYCIEPGKMCHFKKTPES